MYKLYKLIPLLLCLFIFDTISGQQYNSIIQTFLNENIAELDVQITDISDWVVTNEHLSKKSDVIHVYIRQRHAGIEIFNGVANFGIKEGQVWHVGNNLVANLATKTNATIPLLAASDAIAQAAAQLALPTATNLQLLQTINSQTFLFDKGNISQENIPVKLMYQAMENGDIRLAWDLSIYTLDSKHWWSVRIDALTGLLLEQHDWVISCDFSVCQNIDHQKINHQDYTSDLKTEICVDAFNELQSLDEFAPSTDQYNVFAIPVESPNHGGRTLLVGPYDAAASPFGWHDTNGAAGAEFTNTTGNNVVAQEDVNGNDGVGVRPDGGPSLDFNFALNLNQAPLGYQNAATTNLFYMNNIMHDIWYHYGFDEASGNFQENNYGRGGTASDNVEADAQDGSGLDNANFATPVDGINPRMQMFLWTAPTASPIDKLTINAPATLARGYNAIPAAFGAPIPTVPLTRDLVKVIDNTAPTNDACEVITNGAALNGKIAVITRGGCSFILKVKAAQNAGAVGVIMVNNVFGSPFIMGGVDATITIPSVMISDVDGNAIIAALNGGQTVNGTLVDQAPNGFQLDGDLDNGIIAHEYGHGISRRLAGGPMNSGCLSNAEQMGEGWSDWFALMLTIEPSDIGPNPRGIGTYAIGESPLGLGIRPMPYTTNTAINNATYALTNNTATITQPHGIGFVWCTMLWDLTWAFINTYGYDDDLYTGTGGNNILMDLVIEALKLQPCSPGFVDGRDAILAADVALNAGENACLIWNVFAARGLGLSATQGSTNSRIDQTQAFNMPGGTTTPLSSCIATLSTLPIELLSFGASPIHNSQITCVWTTASESNNNYFVVERSKDAIHFEEAGILPSKGNSQTIQEYLLIDKNPFAGLSYYRLKQVDIDDNFSYSNIVTVELQVGSTIQLVPNPNAGIFSLIIGATESYEVECSIYNTFGTKISQQNISQKEGISTYDFDISAYPSGTYIMILRDNNGQLIATKRMVKN